MLLLLENMLLGFLIATKNQRNSCLKDVLEKLVVKTQFFCILFKQIRIFRFASKILESEVSFPSDSSAI